jgi:putative oxidoreductase
MYTSPPRESRHIDQALLILRLAVGIVFLVHGYQKLFVWGLAGTTQGFAQMGAPLPNITGPLIAIIETFGGAALMLGLRTNIVAIPLAVDMFGAIMIVHRHGGFFVPKGIEFVGTLFAVCVALALSGSGYYSVDGVIARRRAGK